MLKKKSDRFKKLFANGLKVKKIATGFEFTEGPVWNKEGKYLLFSDIPGDIRRKWSQRGGIEEIKKPSNKCNGLTYDNKGNLIICEHVTSRIVKEYPNGKIEVLASHYKGKELNSPNDVIVSRDGSIYFTDPIYGRMAVIGQEREQELDFQGVFRSNPNL